MRKNIALPLVLHGVFAAVEDTLAEGFEGEVRSMSSILRMFEPSFRRLFLKFERFSSLRKSCRRAAQRMRLRARLDFARLRRAAIAPPFGNLLFTIRDKSRAIAAVIGGIAARRARPARCLSVRLSGL
jgi:hypothetical protein